MIIVGTMARNAWNLARAFGFSVKIKIELLVLTEASYVKILFRILEYFPVAVRLLKIRIF